MAERGGVALDPGRGRVDTVPTWNNASASSPSAWPTWPGPAPFTSGSAGGARRSSRPSSSRPAGWPWCSRGRDKLADDAGLADRGADGFGGLGLAQNVRSREEVDAILREAADAGATVTRLARDTFYGGYAGCFTDPDGHLWEVAWNPGFPLAGDGTLTVPDFGAPS
ncbi:VOC family protein [Micromonospora sp. NBC_00898]|uniref:VOC family protein n=1 Tax=Micromonospora sp. NBC_00898 TaxID=2975981 RepID=UPI003868D2D1|nr:VOC family protein [Micromonospora sp. NBC_00898]